MMTISWDKEKEREGEGGENMESSQIEYQGFVCSQETYYEQLNTSNWNEYSEWLKSWRSREYFRKIEIVFLILFRSLSLP